MIPSRGRDSNLVIFSSNISNVNSKLIRKNNKLNHWGQLSAGLGHLGGEDRGLVRLIL